MQPDEHVPFQQEPPAALPDDGHASWSARLELGFERGGADRKSGGSAAREGTLLRHRHEGPLRIQKALYPEGANPCHAIIVHPPGGIAGGDQLHIHIDTARDSHGLVTTPSAQKWYGAAFANPAVQRVHMLLEGALEWLPQETIVFNRAEVRSEVLVRIGRDASMIGWDHLIFGRRASGETFVQGAFRQSLCLEIDDRVVWRDRIHLHGADALFDSPVGLRGHHAFATLWAVLPASARWSEPVVGALRDDSPAIAWTVLHERLLVGRLLAPPLQIKPMLVRAWGFLRPRVVGLPAVAPRLWAT